MGKKVLKAVLFEGFHHPTLGNMKPTFPQDDKSLKDFEMSLEDNGTLFIQWSGGTVGGRPTPAGACSIGVSNIKVLVHAYEAPTPKAVAKAPEQATTKAVAKAG